MAEPMGRVATARGSVLMEPSTMASDIFPDTNWGETDRAKNPDYKKDFNRIRWANVQQQLDEIKKVVAGKDDEPVWAMLTVQSGYNDFKKIGLEIRPQHLSPKWARQMALRQTQVKNLLAGAHEGPGDGDMDAYVEVQDLDELSTKHLMSKAHKVLQEDVDPITVKLDYDTPAVRQSLNKDKDGKPKSESKPLASDLKERLRQHVFKCKDLGADDAQVVMLVQELCKEWQQKKSEEDKREGTKKRAEQGSSVVGGDTRQQIELIRQANACAWIVFHLVES